MTAGRASIWPSRTALRNWCSAAIDEHGAASTCSVNSVGGVRLRLDGFLATTDDDFEWAMQMNSSSAAQRRVRRSPYMVEQGSGAIVNVASVNAFFQPDGATIDSERPRRRS